jgi:DNA-binding transcriptional MocR family regulator
VKDDVCADFPDEAAAPPLLAGEDAKTAAESRVVTPGTLSMTLVPSLRLGDLIAPPDLAAAFAAARGVSQGRALPLGRWSWPR